MAKVPGLSRLDQPVRPDLLELTVFERIDASLVDEVLGSSAEAQTITLDFTGTTATETSDYTVGSKTLELGVGSTSVTTTVTAVDDTDADPNEQVKIAELTGEPRDVDTRVDVELHPHEASR